MTQLESCKILFNLSHSLSNTEINTRIKSLNWPTDSVKRMRSANLIVPITNGLFYQRSQKMVDEHIEDLKIFFDSYYFDPETWKDHIFTDGCAKLEFKNLDFYLKSNFSSAMNIKKGGGVSALLRLENIRLYALKMIESESD